MVKQLDSIPNLVPLYATAAAGATKKRPKSVNISEPALAVRGVVVSRGRDERFRDTVGAPKLDEAFFGHVHALIMPIQMQLMAADDFPLPMMGLVHTSNTYRQLTPIPLDSKVDLEVRVDGFRAHRSGTEVVLRSTVTAADSTGGAEAGSGAETGTVLAEEESVYLAKGVRLDEAEGFEAVEEQRQAIKEGRETVRREAFAVPVPTAQWSLPASTGRTWAAVSGDWNPIHITNLTAKALGMPGAIAHGMYTASRALAESDLIPGAPFEFTIAFGAPVVLPSKVNVAITRAGEVIGAGAGGAGVGAGGADSDKTAGADLGVASARGGMDIVAWDRKKKRPYFTGSVRDLV